MSRLRKKRSVLRQTMHKANKRNSPAPTSALRFGLCCQFAEQPIKFRTTTATVLAKLSRREQLSRRLEALAFTVEVEAKARELAVDHLKCYLEGTERSP